jgi:NADPH-dependent 2,4-dienoyl-CoA reductase/sulfur reductase-like enzyme/rhodanese-related sulfurtransferase
MADEQEPLQIVVVGGAAGGLSAALRLRRLDEKASITLIEEHHIRYADSGVPSSIGGVIETDTFLIHQSCEGLKDRFNLNVLECTELVGISREQHFISVKRSNKYDSYNITYAKLILAQGTHPIRPQVQGIDRANVFAFRTMLDLEQIKNYVKANVCHSVAVLGSGYLALKAVEALYSFGLRISVINTQDRLCEDFDPDIAGFVQSELTKNGVRIFKNAKIENIGLGLVEDGCVVTLVDSIVPADLVVVANGLAPRIEIAKAAGLLCKNRVVVNAFMQTSDPDIYAVGAMTEPDCFLSPTPPILPGGSATSHQGRAAANHIMKVAAPYRGASLTYCCKVFHLTAAITGPSTDRLRKAGYYPQTVTVHVPDHTGYYPTSQQMTLRLVFQQGSGRLLNAQIVGRVGVDRRIDVLSTALQLGISVFDLEHLELSYAPQYGSARDPVNVAAMTASNVLRGDLNLVSPCDLDRHLGDWQIIDVRRPESYIKGHVPSARNIPIDSLRISLAGIDKQRPVLVYSRVGYHSYLAYRTLVQFGYRVASLDGGLKLLEERGYGISLVSD